MIFYHGGLNSYQFREGIAPIPRLDTYYHAQKKPRKEIWADPLFMDSGAFSVWKLGGVLSLDAYMEYLRTWANLIQVYASLDVIGDPEATWTTWVRMREAGLDPLPCYHQGEPLKYLFRYVDAGASYIGLGGMAKVQKPQRRAFFHEVFSNFPKEDDVGFHGFGLSDVELCLEYPWRSCDASTAVIHAARRQALTPFGKLEFSERTARTVRGRASNPMLEWVLSVGGEACLERASGGGSASGYECAWITCTALAEIVRSAPTTYQTKKTHFDLLKGTIYASRV